MVKSTMSSLAKGSNLLIINFCSVSTKLYFNFLCYITEHTEVQLSLIMHTPCLASALKRGIPP